MTVPHEASAGMFKGRHFNHEIITLCVRRWYVTYELRYRDLAEMMADRHVALAHTTCPPRTQTPQVWEVVLAA
jgi:hypothetical protein